MKISEALNYAGRINQEQNTLSRGQIDLIETLAAEVERLSAPRPMKDVPDYGDIYIVTSSEPLVRGSRVPGSELRTRLEHTPKHPHFKNSKRFFEPLGWWPVPTTTDDQLNRMIP